MFHKQACTGIEDVGEAFMALEDANWDLMVSELISVKCCQQMTLYFFRMLCIECFLKVAKNCHLCLYWMIVFK